MPNFGDYLKAAYPALWVNTLEPQRAMEVLAKEAVSIKRPPPMSWDIARGFTDLQDGGHKACPSPAKAIEQIAEMPEKSCVFLWNFHRLLGSLEVVQAIQNALPDLKARGNCLVVLAPSSEKIPDELARVFTTIDFALPDRAGLKRVLEEVSGPYGIKAPSDDSVLDAALGLTDMEAQDAFALSLVTTKTLDRELIAREKAGALLRQAQLQVSQSQERFSDLGGLDVLKAYTLKTAVSSMSLGILLLGVPGTGKSTFARALGQEIGVPTLSLDISKMMGSLVGQSEANMRHALKAVDSIGRCVLYLDEIEKSLSGTKSSGETDSGTKAGVGGTFLKWLSDRTPGRAYCIATANSINLPPEFLRSERWDSLWFLDLPNREEKEVIWNIYQVKYNLGGDRPNDEGWTGSDIKACCRTAAMLQCRCTEAAQYIVPVTRSMGEQINELREWAQGRCVMASRPEARAAGGRRIELGR